ncbi:MAG: hypothetical protein HYZ31_09810, partial [Gammaproteobacteria bacterium]|nr:hypothetical protein [Gammaproteobacteria bacterium]
MKTFKAYFLHILNPILAIAKRLLCGENSPLTICKARRKITVSTLPWITTSANVNMPCLIYGTAWKKADTADLVEQALLAGFRGIKTSGPGLTFCIHLWLIMTPFTPFI